MMRLSEILKPQNVRVSLQAITKTEAISELVDLLAANGELQEKGKVLDSVMEREATRTTGIGSGLAIPHGKCSGVDHLVMAVGRASQPIDFQAIDGKPVTLIWLLISPPDKTGPHITALARISKLMTVDKFRKAMNEAQTSEQVYNLIIEQETAILA